jgi:hypothetical protein
MREVIILRILNTSVQNILFKFGILLEIISPIVGGMVMTVMFVLSVMLVL